MADETDWPYDAIQDDPLTALRIPVVTTAYPQWSYLVAFDLDGVDEATARPDDREAAMLRSFLDEYIVHWYGQSWSRKKLLERPFDIDGDANGVIFRKWGAGDWGYRRRSWTMGPLFWPGPPGYRETWGEGPSARAYPLAALMDRIHTHGDADRPARRWLDWKAAHPEVFDRDAAWQ